VAEKKAKYKKDETDIDELGALVKETEPKYKADAGLEDIIFEQDPLYTKGSGIEDMENRNKDFYENASKVAFTAIMNEEKKRLKELVEAEYRIEEHRGDDISEVDLVLNKLNFIK
jgi:hypothetical protein